MSEDDSIVDLLVDFQVSMMRLDSTSFLTGTSKHPPPQRSPSRPTSQDHSLNRSSRSDHRKAVEEDRGVSEYAFDHCFPGDKLGFKLVVLVGQ